MMPLGLNPPEQERNWLDLPSDVMLNIFDRIGMVDILDNVQKVCTFWCKVCKDPSLWRVINMNDLWHPCLEIIYKDVVDRSQGQLVDITLRHDNDAALLLYIADRSSQLRRLEMAFCSNLRGLTTEFLTKFPLLEELNFYSYKISTEGIKAVGRYCPMLKTLKVNEKVHGLSVNLTTDEETLMRFNKIAIAIGQNLPELKHLELIGNDMTDIGLQVILDNCHHLETLDLRGCRNIDFKRDLAKNCSQQIKHLKLPDDSLDGCPYYHELVSESSDDGDYEYYDDGDYEHFGDVDDNGFYYDSWY